MFAGMVLLGGAYTLTRQRARAGRPGLRHGVGAHAHLDRHPRRPLLPAADLRDPHLLHLAVVRRLLAHRRGLVQRRRPDPLARQDAAAGRLRADGAAGRLRDHQARRRARPRDHVPTSTTKSRCNESFIRDNMAAADVRGPDRVHADRLSRGVLAGGDRPVLRLHRHRVRADPARTFSATSPTSSTASSRTTCCSRSRSSPSWARSSSAAASPRICSIRSASCSGRSAAACPTR